MTFGEKLLFLRNLKGLSARQVADAVGLSSKAIEIYENGLRKPRNVAVYRALANLLGCSIEELRDDSVSIMPDDPHEKSEKKAAPKKAETAPEIKAEAPVVEKAPAKKADKKVVIASHGRTMDAVPLDYVIEKTSKSADKTEDQPITESAPETKPEKAEKPDISEPFGKRLGALRKEKNLTLAQVADSAGINLGSYKHMEYRNGRPRTIGEYEKLAEVLGCEVSYLTEGDERFENGVLKAPEKKNSDMTFGEKLHNLRTEKGLSLTQISDAVGIKKGAYSGMEYKNSRPTDVKVYDKLAEVLGCDVDYLIEGDKRFENKPAQSVEKPEPTPIVQADDVNNIEETPSDVPFGKKLSTLRKQKGLTLAQLAEKAGISVEVYKGLEYRNYRPRDIKAYNKLARALGCPVDYLREGDKRFNKADAPAVKKAAPVKATDEKKAPNKEKIVDTEKPVAIVPVENKAIEVPITEADLTESKPAQITETKPAENKAAEVPELPIAEVVPEKQIPIEEQIPTKTVSASSKSSELIKLVSRLSVLLASDEISKDEKDAVMVSLNGAYWGRT